MTEATTKKKLGQLTKDGIYIGRFKDKDGAVKDWFADVEDARDASGKKLLMNFNDAAKYADNSRILGHKDWVLPSGWNDPDGKPDILGAMFNSKSIGAFKGKFDGTGSFPGSWYWTSSQDGDSGTYAKIQRFSDGIHDPGFKPDALSVRLVRSVAV